MKTAVTTAVSAPPELFTLLRARVADYREMAKPGIASMVLVTVAAGFCLASPAAPDWLLLCHTLVGTALLAAGASVLNNWMERRTDALMHRTENRPLPAGRLQPAEAMAFGLIVGLSGLVYLAVMVAQPVCMAVGAVTFVSYVWIYTPLKKQTSLNTLVGAVPGALPPVIGWTAATGELGRGAWLPFLILFLWQVPHFLAIAWIYRADYARAGLRMLPVSDPTGRKTGRHMVLYCLCLVAVSLSPVLSGTADFLYFLGAVMVGGAFLWTTVLFSREPSTPHARLVLRGSLLYLPVILVLILVFGIKGL